MSNVIDITSRLDIVPSFEQLDREAEAWEAAQDAYDAVMSGENEIDMDNPVDRARAVNGALERLDFIPITGAEYWAAYPGELNQNAFGGWARKSLSVLTDIVAELDRLEGRR